MGKAGSIALGIPLSSIKLAVIEQIWSTIAVPDLRHRDIQCYIRGSAQHV